MNFSKVIIISMVALLVSACSAKFDVVHVKKGDLSTALEKPGVFYTLPKTQFVLELPMRIATAKSGLWELDRGGVRTTDFEEILKHCKNGGADNELTKLPDPNETRTLFLGQPNLQLQTVADEDQIYFLDAKFGWFANFSHTVGLGKTGVVKSIDSTVTNPSVTATKFVVDLVAAVAAFGAASNCRKIDALNNRVKALQGPVNTAIKAKSDFLTKFVGLESPIKHTDSDLLADAIKILDARISEAKAAITSNADYREAYGSSLGNNYYTLSQIHEPDSAGVVTTVSTTVKYAAKPETDLTAGNLANVRKQDVSSSILEDELRNLTTIADHIKNNNLVEVALSKKGIANIVTTAPPADKKGYRYRIPGYAEAVVSVIGSEALKTNVAVAQIGHIAFLPAKIGGLSANIAPTFDADSGGLTNIVLGATPADTKSALSTVDSIKELLDKEEAPSELDVLTKENNLLTAKKTNKQLKQELGIE